jgi:hypothetical protein
MNRLASSNDESAPTGKSFRLVYSSAADVAAQQGFNNQTRLQ